MSNTSKGPATKGSKFWMQYIVNSNLKNNLNNHIGCNLQWLSPLKGKNNDYLEYELRQNYICNTIGINDSEKNEIFSFWPNRQPQWDGIALSQDGRTIYLVEAKAHLSELKSKISASSETSRSLIVSSMREVFELYYPGGKFSLWRNGYYQLANRLTFLHKLNERLKVKNLEVKLLLLNFVGDYTYKPTDFIEWETHYNEVFKDMIGVESTPENVIVINFPVDTECVDPEF
ncbi:hypothetical protein [Clostridium intestinale]|uniref:Uncharacterized protein n=1 Tax=Clostridium intestinale TaxID=36845 RepID=A0A7D6ZID2_9CLOT|nr:hypothetical protein [Clostridium intestinale]QLY81241.1 hypothetical protein HZF06_06540 [Clostridium intestinale]